MGAGAGRRLLRLWVTLALVVGLLRLTAGVVHFAAGLAPARATAEESICRRLGEVVQGQTDDPLVAMMGTMALQTFPGKLRSYAATGEDRQMVVSAKAMLEDAGAARSQAATDFVSGCSRLGTDVATSAAWMTNASRTLALLGGGNSQRATVPDVDCGSVGRPVKVPAGDPHRLDGDGDGIGCERH